MDKTPEHLKYASSHEWVQVDGEIGTIGITDHAQHELSDVVYVELPKKGRMIGAGEVVAVVESVKAASDIYSPVSGQIIDINEELVSHPNLVNSSPYEKGWLYKIKLSNSAELGKLLHAAAYLAQLGK